ncbi:shikimate dehydrogenase [Alkalilimnicola ehrlichii MLHE-1]|uniref:Shikimate dehydrogenase (NADP(+)) n=1 Tax=Alkalilimnicola ehrlichii (strain ATCC BAA-1101 / DSM 17681 / MLHE-1) TaxID=187272 RepID=AROE_ALKEH|nr:shikimate dehydrogenase [Alkalilimnicola ehrlichii]Q0A4S2.1 RecName: Full=Shikimate dehydrogenase (NADP(+)); Short=SDH [Alkalilimnicola ehrlichii MLHE-1]ABI58165.1 shikimate dehydrogenase [Alkalilimnicola ehrlichii MLHE-1]
MTDRYAVMGNPIEHSKSPEIHRMFAEQTGQAIAYERMRVPLEGFEPAVRAFFASGGKGLNITVPFKEQAWVLVDRRAPRAERAGAVNTLLAEAGRLVGDNTDGTGLVRDLTVNHGAALQGRRVLVIGAGGAVRGVLPALLPEAPGEVVIANRTVARAEALVELFADQGRLSAVGFDRLQGPFDVVINGTSAGLAGELPPLPDDLLAPGATCYDMVYGDQPTPFVRWARAHGAAMAVDGLGMLVEQAAESFLIWRGVRPESAPVIAALRPE